MTHAEFTPEDFGVPAASIADLAGGDAATNAAITRAVLGGERGPQRDVTLINAAAAIVAAGLAEGFADGIAHAEESIDSGAAAASLDAAVRVGSDLQG